MRFKRSDSGCILPNRTLCLASGQLLTGNQPHQTVHRINTVYTFTILLSTLDCDTDAVKHLSPVKRICVFRHDKLQLRMPSHSEGPGIWLSF